METIDALSFDKEQSFDRIVSCSLFINARQQIFDINHTLLDDSINATDTMLTLSFSIKNGVEELITFFSDKVSNTLEPADIEICLSNDQMSLCMITAIELSNFRYNIKGNSLICNFDTRDQALLIDSDYKEVEYFKQREGKL